MNPEPPALESITLSLGVRGGGTFVFGLTNKYIYVVKKNYKHLPSDYVITSRKFKSNNINYNPYAMAYINTALSTISTTKNNRKATLSIAILTSCHVDSSFSVPCPLKINARLSVCI